jgi:hypothetical protein
MPTEIETERRVETAELLTAMKTSTASLYSKP